MPWAEVVLHSGSGPGKERTAAAIAFAGRGPEWRSSRASMELRNCQVPDLFKEDSFHPAFEPNKGNGITALSSRALKLQVCASVSRKGKHALGRDCLSPGTLGTGLGEWGVLQRASVFRAPARSSGGKAGGVASLSPHCAAGVSHNPGMDFPLANYPQINNCEMLTTCRRLFKLVKTFRDRISPDLSLEIGLASSSRPTVGLQSGPTPHHRPVSATPPPGGPRAWPQDASPIPYRPDLSSIPVTA